VTAYSNTNCTGQNEGTTTTCTDVGQVYGSIFYDAGPVPVPNCGSPAVTTNGKAALDQPSTICCAQ
jgi:hypothetical protein